MMGHDFQSVGSRGVADGVTISDGVLVDIGFAVEVRIGDGEATVVGDTFTGFNMEAETDCVAQAVRRRHNTKYKKRFIKDSIRTKS
jgi:hypothetical protein